MPTSTERVREHRQRRERERVRMQAALMTIVERLTDRPGPLAQEVRQIAVEALGE